MSEMLYARLKADLASILREYYPHEHARELARGMTSCARLSGFKIARQRVTRERNTYELDKDRAGQVSGVG